MNTETDMTDDEQLSAYIDGELSLDATTALTARLAQEPQLLKRLEQLRKADDAQRDLYAALAEQPLPQAVVDMLSNEGAESKGDLAGDNIVAFPPRGPAAFLQVPVGIAASIALVVGFLVGGFQGNGDVPGDSGLAGVSTFAGTIAAESRLHQLLEAGRSGAPTDKSQPGSGRVILSFQSPDGDYCRQVEVAEGNGAMQALACRRNGDWQLAAASFGASSAPAGNYVAATAQATVVRAAVTQLMGDREPLTPAAEAELIANGWQPPTN